MLQEKYKFYLSFENSLCKEYLTEKVTRPLKNYVVPIVLGGADYATILPHHSYIDVRNFASAKMLADYLLDVNDTRYNSYFEWKIHYQEIRQAKLQCSVCDYLHRHKGETHSLASLHQLWNKENDCYSSEQFYTTILYFVTQLGATVQI
jgi:hypothetical protein